MAFTFTNPSGGTLAFGNVTFHTSSQQSATAHNSASFASNEEIDPTNIAISGPGAAMFSLNPDGGGGINNGLFNPYGPQESNTGFIVFAPTSAAAFTATLTITYNATNTSTGHRILTGGTLTLALTGTGVTGGGSSVGEAPSLILSFRRELVPSTGTAGIVLAYYDETTLNDANDGRQYIFKAEDILADRVPTVRRVILTYVDLGVATITATINGVDDTGTLVTAASTVSIGTVAATGRLLTAFIDLQATCFRPQLTLSQGLNAGPFQLSTAMLTGTIEKEVTL
jgi:hypothetical protein